MNMARSDTYHSIVQALMVENGAWAGKHVCGEEAALRRLGGNMMNYGSRPGRLNCGETVLILILRTDMVMTPGVTSSQNCYTSYT